MFQPDDVIAYTFEKSGRTLQNGSIWDVLKEYADLIKAEPELALALLGSQIKTSEATAYNSRDLDYAVGGIFQANTLSREIEKAHGDRKSLDILDFGCGAARLLRYFLCFKPQHRYHACEVNKYAVNYVRKLSKNVDVRRIDSHPPSPFQSESMDVVYAWSIWTHFDAATGRAWLEEAHRLLRHGGCALITVHTDELVKRYGVEPKLVETMKARGGDYEKIYAEYQVSGLSYWRAYPQDARQYGIDNESFGMAFISNEYIRRNWSDLFDIEGVCTGIPHWQDVVILKKR